MTPFDFYASVLTGLGAPASQANLNICDQWATDEGMYNPKGLAFSRGFNPWMTTEQPAGVALSTEDVGFGPGKWNPEGVKMFASAADGIKATIATFTDGASWYGPIIVGFKLQMFTPAVANALHIWIYGPNGDPTVHDYDVTLSAFMAAQWGAAPAPAPIPAPALTDAQTAAVKGIIDGSFGPILLALLRQILGLDPTTFSPTFQPSIDQIRAALTQPANLGQIYADIGRAASQFGSAVTAAGAARGSQ